MITLFFSGLFTDFINQLIGNIVFGSVKTTTIGSDILQIIMVVWAVRIYYKSNPIKKLNNHRLLTTIFLTYIAYFLIVSLFVNGDRISLTFAELYEDIMPFILFFILAKTMQFPYIGNNLNLLFFRLINAQILFSIVKIIVLMRPYEGLVGSITGITNGGPGTSLPLLGIIYIAINTKMSLRIKDVWMIFGLLLTGFLAGKRAVWLLFPVLYILLSIYVFHRRLLKNLVFAAVLVPLFVYTGLRLMPTLNPENEIWGSFDPEYAWNYGQKYSTGREDASDEIIEGTGRVGALVLALNKVITDSPDKTFFGYGLEHFVLTKTNYFDSNYWWGIDGRGSITGILYKYFSIGLIGVILYTIYIYIILHITFVKNKRLKFVIILVVLFDYVFYNATIITFPSLFALLLFEMRYDTSLVEKRKLV
jgi:hypothetical protein